MTHATRRATLVILLPLAVGAAAGCSSNEKQSLVLAEIKLSTPGTQANGLQSVMLSADPGLTKTYTINTLSGDEGVVLGLYLPGSVTGQVTITATAAPTTGCAGYRGSSIVTIDSPGITKSITVLMDGADLCQPDGGSGGGGGSAGTTGNGGNGGTTGSAGTGGMTGTAGTGGSAGTAGTAGRGGTTGTAGTGGVAGTTGMAGRGGTTGTAGTGGVAGTTGAAGRGGTTGTAGSGGTTGTGGMAGYPSISGCRSFNHCATSTCNNSIRAIAISPNGQLVASAADDGRVKIWNFDGHNLTNSGTVFTGFTGYAVAFSPDGMRLAYTSGTMVRSYMVSGWAASTTYLNDGSSNDMVGVAFTPNSQRVVSADAIGSAGGDLFVHNVGTALPALTAHISKQPSTLGVSTVAASDGSVGIAVGTYGGNVSALTLGANAISAPTDLVASSVGEAVWAVGFTVDGKSIVSGDGNGAIKFWGFPITSTTSVGTDIKFAGGDTVNALAFSPNGMYMAVGGAFSVAQLSIYTLSTRAESARVTPASDINAVVFAPNGTSLIAGEYTNALVVVCD